MALSISVLPQRLVLACLPAEHVEEALTTILRLLFFKREERFFSYTCSPEVSIVVDEATLESFPSNLLQESPGVWRAIQIWEGADAIDQPGIVSSLSRPLSEKGVEMIYLSTHNTDLILVKEDCVEEARKAIEDSLPGLIETLKQKAEAKRQQQQQNILSEEQPVIDRSSSSDSSSSLASEFEAKMSCSASPSLSPSPAPSESGSEISDSVSAHGSRPASVASQRAGSVFGSTDDEASERCSSEGEGGGEDEDERHAGGSSMNLIPMSHRLALVSFHKRHLESCAFALLRIVLSERDAPTSFFSFTEAGDECSLILEKEHISLFPEGILQANAQDWKALAVSAGSAGFDPTGMVWPLSAELARVGISIYYLSTFNTDFTLVVESQFQQAISTLVANLDVMVEKEF